MNGPILHLRALSLLVVAAATLLLAPAAMADEACDNGLDGFGRCEGRHSVAWCSDDGTFHQVQCAAGEICAPSSGGKGFTCLPREATECRDIPATGSCAPSSEVVRFCVNGTAKSIQCEGDNECGWSPNTQSYDCVAKGTLVGDYGPEDAPESAADQATSDVWAGSDLTVTPGGPGPSVKSGPDSLPTPPGDCSGGGAPWTWWLATFPWLCLRGRRSVA